MGYFSVDEASAENLIARSFSGQRDVDLIAVERKGNAAKPSRSGEVISSSAD